MPISRTVKDETKDVIKQTQRTLKALSGFSVQSRSSSEIQNRIRLKNTANYGDFTIGKDIMKKIGNPKKIQIMTDGDELIIGSKVFDHTPEIELKPNGANFKIQSKALVLEIIKEFNLDANAEFTFFNKIDFEKTDDGNIYAVVSMIEEVSYE